MKKQLLLILLSAFVTWQVSASGNKKQVKLRVTEVSTSVFDETSVNLDLGVRQFIFPEDGQKIFDTSSSAPALYSFSGDMVPCFSNSYGTFTPAMVIPLGLRAEGNGLYMIRATLLDNFDPTSIIRLEDRQLSNFHDLRSGDYTFLLNQPTITENRFFLHVSYPAQVSATDAGCSNNDGTIFIQQDNSIAWTTCTLYDDSSNVVYTNTNISNNFAFGALAYGEYHLEFAYGNYAATNSIYVNGWSIENSVNASAIYATAGQTINFYSTSTHTSDYQWDFGDGSSIDGIANPDYAFTQPGTYTVTLTGSNSRGCTGTSSITVYISAATGLNDISETTTRINMLNRDLQVTFNRQLPQAAVLEVINTTGQLVHTQQLTQAQTTTNLGYLPAGIYIVRVANGSNSLTQKVVLN